MITREQEASISSKLKSSARKMLSMYGDESEEIIYLSGLGSRVKENLINTIREIRKSEELKWWNRGVIKEA